MLFSSKRLRDLRVISVFDTTLNANVSLTFVVYFRVRSNLTLNLEINFSYLHMQKNFMYVNCRSFIITNKYKKKIRISIQKFSKNFLKNSVATYRLWNNQIFKMTES